MSNEINNEENVDQTVVEDIGKMFDTKVVLNEEEENSDEENLEEEINEEDEEDIEEEDNNEEEDEEEEEEEIEEEDEENEEESDEKDTIIKQLLETIKELTKKTEDKKEKEPPKITEEDLFEGDSFSALTEEMDWDEKEIKTFKTFLTAFGKQVHQTALKQIMADTPELINKTIKTQSGMEKVRTDFYTANPKLKNFQPLVAQLSKQVAEEKGKDAKIEDVLKSVAEKAYSLLGIKKGKVKNGKAGKGKKPAFTKPKGARKKGTKKTGLAKELDAMMEIDL